MIRKVFSVVTCAVLIGSMTSVAGFAAEEKSSVRVIVENNTYAASDGAAWEGTLIDQWVDIDADATAASVLSGVMTGSGYADPVADGMYGAYVDGVNGLYSGSGAELEGSMYPGWMFAVNDWFGNNGIGSFSAADGTLTDGDELRVSYSLNMGADLGSDFYSTDTTLASLTVSGQLSPEFQKDVTEYDVILDENQTEIFVVPETANKNFCCRIYQGEYTPDQPTSLRSSRAITAADGDKLYIGIGSSEWQYVSEGTQETVYVLNIRSTADNPENPQPEQPGNPEQQEPYTGEESTKLSVDEILNEMTQRITADDSFAVFGNEWQVMTLARLDKLTDAQKAAYLSSVENYLKENELSKATDNARLIITLTALGADVTDFAGKDLTSQLSDMDYVSRQGINGVIFSLIALDTGKYPVPVCSTPENQSDREKMIDNILSAQLPDGGWTFYGDVAEPDLTGMAIEALAPYYKDNAAVKTAVDKALQLLSGVQNKDGTYTSYGAANSECSAQVVTALCALQIDPDKDTWFAKAEGTALTGLKRFYLPEDKGFSHTLGDAFNQYADLQGFYALCAYSRMSAGKTALYDMSDVFAKNNDSQQPQESAAPQNENPKDSPEKTENTQKDNVDKTQENGNIQTVPTGEESSAWIWIVIVAASAAVVVVLILTGKKSGR